MRCAESINIDTLFGVCTCVRISPFLTVRDGDVCVGDLTLCEFVCILSRLRLIIYTPTSVSFSLLTCGSGYECDNEGDEISVKYEHNER